LASPATFFQFRVALREIVPTIWRRILVPGDYTFWDLHVAIQDAMGWLDYHLHLFRVESPLIDAAAQIGIPDEDFFEGDERILPGWEVPVAAYLFEPGDTAVYEYDFGDGWEHDLTLEAILPDETGKHFPICLAGQRACPPEDCGGVGGYENVIEVLRNPDHEEHASMLSWVGGSYDPAGFDPGRVKFEDPAQRWKKAFEGR
jgi:hypothetical protein